MNWLEIAGVIFILFMALTLVIAFLSFTWTELQLGKTIKEYLATRSTKKALREINKLTSVMDKYLDNDIRHLYRNYKAFKGMKTFEEFLNWIYGINFKVVEKLDEEREDISYEK